MVFYAGELVSCGYSTPGPIVTGRVVQLHRNADRRPFLMIQITSGPRQGQRTWPGEHWQLGAGPHEGRCERCRRPFRYQDGEVGHTCQRCWNADQVPGTGNSDRPRSSWERKQLRDRGDKELVTS